MTTSSIYILRDRAVSILVLKEEKVLIWFVKIFKCIAQFAVCFFRIIFGAMKGPYSVGWLSDDLS